MCGAYVTLHNEFIIGLCTLSVWLCQCENVIVPVWECHCASVRMSMCQCEDVLCQCEDVIVPVWGCLVPVWGCEFSITCRAALWIWLLFWYVPVLPSCPPSCSSHMWGCDCCPQSHFSLLQHKFVPCDTHFQLNPCALKSFHHLLCHAHTPHTTPHIHTGISMGPLLHAVVEINPR